MKTYRKNKTQSAKLFVINGKTMLGFLVGEFKGKMIIEMNGELKTTTVNNKISDSNNEIGKSEEFEETVSTNGRQTTRIKTFKDGSSAMFVSNSY